MVRYMGDFAKQIPLKHVSKYALRMMKLRSKLFNEYIRTPMPYEISRAVLVDPRQRQAWDSHHFQNEQMVNRFSQLPSDLDHIRSIRYYPAHPQIGDLMSLLRQHGLYRFVNFQILYSVYILIKKIFFLLVTNIRILKKK